MTQRPEAVGDPARAGRRAEQRDLGAEVVVAIYRLLRLVRMHDVQNQAFIRQLEQTHSAVLEFCARTESSVNVLFAMRAVFVSGKLLRGSRATYGVATELGEMLDWCGGAELTILRDVTRDELRSFAESVNGALGAEKGRAFRVQSPCVRLRPLNEAARLRGLDVERLDIDQGIVRAYASAVVIMRRLFEDLQNGRWALPRRVKRVAQKLVDLSAGSTPAFLGVTEVRNANHDEAGRAVNGAILAVAMARRLTNDRATLAQVAMAAMLHDVGRARAQALASASAPALAGAAMRLSEDEEDRLAAGTASILASMGRFNEASITRTVITFEALWIRRARILGPVYLGVRAPTLQARIIAVARRYNDLLTPEPGLPPPPPDFAVAKLWTEPTEPSDRQLVRLLVAALGLMPVGTVVRLSTGETAEVIFSDRPSTGRPKVRVLIDADGSVLDEPVEVDLSDPPIDPPPVIAKVVSTNGWSRGLSLGPSIPATDEPRVVAAHPGPSLVQAARASRKPSGEPPRQTSPSVRDAITLRSPSPKVSQAAAPTSDAAAESMLITNTPTSRKAAAPLLLSPANAPESLADLRQPQNVTLTDSLAALTASARAPIAPDFPFAEPTRGAKPSSARGPIAPELGPSDSPRTTKLPPERGPIAPDFPLASSAAATELVTLPKSPAPVPLAASLPTMRAPFVPELDWSAALEQGPPDARGVQDEPAEALSQTEQSADSGISMDSAPELVAPHQVLPGVAPHQVLPRVAPLRVLPGVAPLRVLPGVAPLRVLPGVAGARAARSETEHADEERTLFEERPAGWGRRVDENPPLPAPESVRATLTPPSGPATPAWHEDVVSAVPRGIEPVAHGTLGGTPLVHVLVYMLDHGRTGSLVLQEPEGWEHVVYFAGGSPARVKTERPIALLGRYLVDAKLLEHEAAAQAVDEAGRQGTLLGEHLTRQGLLSPENLAIALEAQVAHKLAGLANLPDPTRFAFYTDLNLLDAWAGGGGSPCDPLAAILECTRAWKDRTRVLATLNRMGAHAIRPHSQADWNLLPLDAEERAVTGAIRSKANGVSLQELIESGVADVEVVRSVIYVLGTTRQLATKNRKGPPLKGRRGTWVRGGAPMPIRPTAAPRTPTASRRIVEAPPSAASTRYAAGRKSDIHPSPPRDEEVVIDVEAFEVQIAAGTDVLSPVEKIAKAVGDFHMAQEALQRGEISTAEKLASEAAQADPEQGEYIALLAWIRAKRSTPGALAQAVEMLTQVLENEPTSARALLYRGRLYKRDKRFAEALGDFETLLAADPDNQEAATEIKVLRGHLKA